HFGKIGENEVRRVGQELLARKTSGRDCDCARADCFPASDVVRSVANHVNRRRLELESMLFPRSVSGESAELIAIVMIIGKGPEFEKLPETVVREFEPRAPLHVAGQQGEHNSRILLQPAQQFLDSGQYPAGTLGQLIREVVDVLPEKGSYPLFVRLDLRLAQDLVNDAAV